MGKIHFDKSAQLRFQAFKWENQMSTVARDINTMMQRITTSHIGTVC